MEGERVCCMCGDIGFPDKIFRCNNCHHRLQHSYCSSNYYSSESLKPVVEVCEWCLTDEIGQTTTSRHHHHRAAAGNSSLSKKPTSKLDAGISSNRPSEYSGEKIKQHDVGEGSSEKVGKSPTGAPSPRTRRYKLLKDVMC